jgi:DNA-binding ferritin-like protein (Dps family)
VSYQGIGKHYLSASHQNDPSSPTPTETEEILILKKTIELLEKKDALNKKLVDRAFDIQDILLSILTDKQNKDFDSFKECMSTMKKDYPEVFEVMYRDLGGDQGKEDEFD